MSVAIAYEFLRKSIAEIYSDQEAASVSTIILEDVFGITKLKRLSNPEKEFNSTDLLRLTDFIKRLLNHEPVQYVTGIAHFMDLKLEVNSNVLIPRPETEELLQWIIDDFLNSTKTVKVLDIGTGSGCIALALKKYLKSSEVYALDKSKNALNLAINNAKKNQLEVYFIHDDILFLSSKQLLKFDIIVSNPPYVLLSEKKLMNKNVLEHEPHLALFVDDSDPILFYKAIADYSLNNLNSKGLLYFEINEKYGEEIKIMLLNLNFINIELRKDFFGKDRFIKAQMPL